MNFLLFAPLVRDCAITIRRGAEKLKRGALHKISAKLEGGSKKNH